MASDRYKWLLSALYWLASGPIEIVRQQGVGSGSGSGQGSCCYCCVIQDLLSCLPSPDINIGPKPGQLLSVAGTLQWVPSLAESSSTSSAKMASSATYCSCFFCPLRKVKLRSTPTTLSMNTAYYLRLIYSHCFCCVRTASVQTTSVRVA